MHPALHQRVARSVRLLASLVALGALAACKPGGNLPPLPPVTASAYLLGTGDEIRVITYGEEQLTGDFKVNDSGMIAMPLLGAVKASCLTTGQLESEIIDQLVKKKLFRNPSVSVEITNYRPIFILGEVAKPGQYPFQPGMTVLSAVATAGGFTYRAVDDRAGVVRVGGCSDASGTAATESLGTRSDYVAPGDVITIFERRF